MTTGRLRRPTRVVAGVVTVLVVLAGAAACTTTDQPVRLPSSGDPTQVTAPPDPGLASYYSQQLAWSACGDRYECTDLMVPLDYAAPDASTDLTLKVLRVPARNQQDRLGSLVVNPGGPGGSGVDYARGAEGVASEAVLRYYDLVGFDPRGVARSEPVDCLDDGALDDFLGQDRTPDDATEVQELADAGKEFVAGCESRAGELLPHLSTEDAARDMDVLRAALGDEQLTYLGKSYGTFLGATYAGLFPERVGRFVLDGVVPPDLSAEQLAAGQAKGFEMATRSYVQDCVDEGDCLLGSTVDEGTQWMRDLLARLDTSPIPSGDKAMPPLNETWASLGMAAALYDQGSWDFLTSALEKADQGDGSSLMALAGSYARRAANGRYTSNIMEVIWAVNCLDRPDSADPAEYHARAEAYSKDAPTWGRFLAWDSLTCGFWPVEPDQAPQPISADGSNPIVVVGTTRDPATIYEWSVRLRDQLASGVLVTHDGDGHTAYRRSNACVDDAIDGYLVRGTVPEDGLTC